VLCFFLRTICKSRKGAAALPKYMTRQRKTLLAYLRDRADEPLSAQAIADALRDEGISLSAVYRNLAELEAAGLVRRSLAEAGREASYQFIGAAACRDCLHLTCKRCGRTFHMDAGGAEELEHIVARTEGFALDKSDTVLYGVCETCRDD